MVLNMSESIQRLVSCASCKLNSQIDGFICTMENKKELDMSSTKAVLLGALAPGVNGPTWNTLKFAFLLLGLCLVVMLGLAFSCNDSSLVLHVGFLVLITATLFLLLSWFNFIVAFLGIVFFYLLLVMALASSLGSFSLRFLSQTGLVSVEHQMQDMNLMPNDYKSK